MKEKQEEKYSIFKDRYLMLAIFFIIFGIIIVFQLAVLQIIHGKEYDEDSQRRVVRERKVIAPRGNILDRNGVPIAVNTQTFAVYIVKTDISAADLNEMLLRLAGIFEKNGDSFNNQLGRYLTFNPITFNGKPWDEIKKWQKNKDIMGLKDDGLIREPEEVFGYLRRMFKIDGGYTDEEAYKIMTLRYEILLDNWKFNTGGAICLAKNISTKSVAEIEEKHHLFPGIITDVEPMRKYIDAGFASHVIGYIRNITGKQYEKLQHEGYGMNDAIGQAGIEGACERYLRGIDGLKKVEVNTEGRLTEELSGKPAIPGHDVVLSIDMNLQRVAIESIERNIKLIREKGGKSNFKDANAGAAVAIDINSGEILAMASYPGYDPSVFLEKADNKEAQEYISGLLTGTSENLSEFNRTIQGTYAPGSTFKPLVAVAALEEGAVTPNELINDTGRVNIGNMDFYCLEYKTGHGLLNLEKALATSCNIYFHIIGSRTGIDNIDKWAKLFGLGELANVDITGEVEGMRANKETKKKLYKENWFPADTAQVSIGQFHNCFSPLQLVRYISAIANGGKLYRPFLVKKVMKFDGSIVNETIPEYETVPVNPETIKAVKKGMVAVTNSIDGTAVQIFKNFPFKVAGKTGTAETGREASQSSNALFVCYAPAEKPEIAVAVVIERGVWGAYAAPVAKDILEEYFGLNGRRRYEDRAKSGEAEFLR